MLQIETLARVAPGSDTETQLVTLLTDAYPEGAPDELQTYYAWPGVPDTTLLLRDGDSLVGHLAMFMREILIGGEPYRVGLIGEVAVAPEHRRRGLARRLIMAAHQHLRSRSAPFAILFAFEPAVYVSSGYKPMRNEIRFLDRDRTWKTLVHRGGMYAELADRPWPNEFIDLRGPVV